MGGGDRDLVMEEAGASESAGDSSKRHEAAAALVNLVGSLAIADDRGVKRKEAARPWEEEGAILRMKKEVTAAWDQWLLTMRSAREESAEAEPGAAAAPQEAPAAAAPAAGKKVKKVVKIKLPKELVDEMTAHPLIISVDLSDEYLDTHSQGFRKVYAAVKLLEAKSRDYWNVLHAQQEELGYAEDEDEVTDEEQEVVVKNHARN